MNSPFRTWTGVEAHQFAPGVSIRAIGGEQVLMCRVEYQPGAIIPEHNHPASEQLMWVIDGDVTLTVEGQTQTLRSGDLAVVNKGLNHNLSTVEGCIFVEALSPVPVDHVPVPERDLVLGAGGSALHVER
jgi:quercetin dioxygenase-like cupin family protein